MSTALLKNVIMDVLPEGIEYTHEVSAFYSSIYGLKGAVKTFRKWCLVHSFLRVARLLGCPFFVFHYMNKIKNLFNGRITRSEWVVSRLYSILILLVGFFITALVGIVVFESESIAYTAMAGIYILTFVIAASCDVRRLHDTGRSWKFILWNFIPFGIFYYIFVLAFVRGDKNSNLYGDIPTRRDTFEMLTNR